jgi:hypothetical protein
LSQLSFQDAEGNCPNINECVKVRDQGSSHAQLNSGFHQNTMRWSVDLLVCFHPHSYSKVMEMERGYVPHLHVVRYERANLLCMPNVGIGLWAHENALRLCPVDVDTGVYMIAVVVI